MIIDCAFCASYISYKYPNVECFSFVKISPTCRAYTHSSIHDGDMEDDVVDGS